MWVKAEQVIPENILLDDIKAKSGNTIIPKDTILTETHIKVIHSFLIEEVNVSSELANGKTFIPQEVTQISKKPTTSSPSKRTKDLSFEKQYEQSVQAYKEMFHKWQSGFSIDMSKVRDMFIPLYDQIQGIEDNLYQLSELSTKEEYMYHHAISVGLLAAYVAKQMEYERGEQIQIGLAGLLMDSGMSKIHPRIFSAERTLHQQEQEDVKQHPTYSYRLVEHIPTLSDAAKLAILQHHERNDGSGYPLGLSKDKIHPYAHILAICDTYHAVACERYYQEEASPFQALEQIVQQKYTKFIETVVESFIRAVSPLEVGQFVQLSTGQKGEIVYIDPDHPVRPIVKVAEDEFIILSDEQRVFIEKVVSKR